MIDGFSTTTEPPEQPHVPACRQMAHALTAEGCTVSELAYLLGTSRLTAWWLSDYAAENDSEAPPEVLAARLQALAGAS
jgi:hypothetical protein